MKLLPLTNSDEKVIVDDEDYEYLNNWNWQIFKSSGHIGRCTYKDKSILLHRVINKTPEGLFTDHINMNKLDNRKENLRTCTKGENSMNRVKQAGNYSSKYKGVCWCKRHNKWKVRVKYKGKVYSLGYHTDEKVAAEVYNNKAKELFGDFFVPNLIEG
jgi:hypothetical protein